MKTKQEIEREILELNSYYNREKEKLEHKLFELFQLEKEQKEHKMKYKTDFYIDIFEHLLNLENNYCIKEDGFNCKNCKFVTSNGICIKNWLINEFNEFVRQAKKSLKTFDK